MSSELEPTTSRKEIAKEWWETYNQISSGWLIWLLFSLTSTLLIIKATSEGRWGIQFDFLLYALPIQVFFLIRYWRNGPTGEFK